MFEIAVFCLILFAIGYWATLFIMGRREDVLHGEFVQADATTANPAPVAVSPVPTRPRVLHPATMAKEAIVSEAPASAPGVATPAPTTMENVPPRPAPTPTLLPLPSPNPERLQSLLVSIKQELKNAAKI
jgi:hypothetical protein